MELWLKGNTDEVRLPVLPPSYSIKSSQGNKTENVIGLGEVSLTGKRGLLNISFSSFFPRRYDSSYCQYRGIDRPQEYVERIEAMKQDGMVKLIITGTPVNLYCLIDSFEWGENDGTGDIQFSLSLKEYRAPQAVKSVVVTLDSLDSSLDSLANASAEARVEAPASSGTYTVKRGDTLTAIARAQLGTSDWHTLYELNKSTIGGNPNMIYPGQELILP